jgi:predicted RNase H-like nuclease (RuvC/YqgF family)
MHISDSDDPSEDSIFSPNFTSHSTEQEIAKLQKEVEQLKKSVQQLSGEKSGNKSSRHSRWEGDSELKRAIFKKDEYTSDLEESLPEKRLHTSKPKHSKIKENNKYDTAIQPKNLECSFGRNMLQNSIKTSQYNTADGPISKGSKLTQMLIKCAENSNVSSEQSSSLTPVEEDCVPKPIPPPKKKLVKKPKQSVFEKV